MNLRGMIGSALIAGTTMTSCMKDEAKEMYQHSTQLLENLMQNKTQKEFDDLKNSFAYGTVGAQSQRAADSIMYRGMFEGTQKAKDSSFVADYNKMMAKTKPALCPERGGYNTLYVNNFEMDKKLKEALTVKEMKKLSKEPLLEERNYGGIGKQYLVDSVYHHKLFEKHGLLDGNGMKKFQKLCKTLRP